MSLCHHFHGFHNIPLPSVFKVIRSNRIFQLPFCAKNSYNVLFQTETTFQHAYLSSAAFLCHLDELELDLLYRRRLTGDLLRDRLLGGDLRRGGDLLSLYLGGEGRHLPG